MAGILATKEVTILAYKRETYIVVTKEACGVITKKVTIPAHKRETTKHIGIKQQVRKEASRMQDCLQLSNEEGKEEKSLKLNK